MHKHKNDIILIIVLLFIAIGGVIAINSFQSNENLKAIVISNDTVILEIELGTINKEKEYLVTGALGDVKIIAKHNSIMIIEANCQDKYCIRQQEITKVGQVITCLPNRLYIKLVGKGADVSL